MTNAAEMDRKSFEYLRKIPGSIYVGVKNPNEDKVKYITLRKDFLFRAHQLLESNVKLVRHAIGIFDDKNQEHILIFENIENIRSCIKYLYSSSHVISRRWYEVLN